MKGIYYSTFVNYDITSRTQNRLTFDLGDILTNNIFEHDGLNFIIVFCFELKPPLSIRLDTNYCSITLSTFFLLFFRTTKHKIL